MVLEVFVNAVTNMISSLGYAGILFLMTLESAVLPVPSEVVMPFAGYLVVQGKLVLWAVVAAATVGNLLGSVIAYFVGKYVGRAVILKYGRYVLLQKRHLEVSENWFKKYGDKFVFISRMLPGVRTVIALPAGIARMNFTKFSIYTFFGSIPWNLAMAYAGIWFGEHWSLIEGYSRWIDTAVIVAVIFALIWTWKKRK